jgi:hypothetical protein
MNRREALKYVAWLTGGAVSAPVISAVLNGARPTAGNASWSPQTLSPEQNELVTTLADLIIPETDTPGAKAARVNEFIDLLLTEWLPAADKERFLSGLNDFDARFQKSYGTRFVTAAAAEQTNMLIEVDGEAAEARRAGAKDKPFFSTMKELTLIGYYTSEIGITQELLFQPATDKYEGCIPLERIGKAWMELNR